MAHWLLCVALSAAGFFFSIGLGERWALAWLAPIPVLWLAFGSARIAPAAVAAFCAYALSGLNFLPAYLGVLPPVVLTLAICSPALLFALAVAAAALAYRRRGWCSGVVAFAASWAAFDFLLAFDPAGGSALTPAASQVGMPVLLQSASVFGFCGVTFILGAVSCALAVALRARSAGAAGFGLVLFAANAGFGAWRMSAPLTETRRVALIASDEAVGAFLDVDRRSAEAVLEAYAREARTLRGTGVSLIVLPENLMRLDPEWRDDALAPIAAAARDLGADIIVGFNTRVGDTQHNVAWVVRANGEPLTYAKRQLVPGLETDRYTRGNGPLVTSDKVLVAICKDLDFPAMIRSDVAATSPVIAAVPAWDFGADGWSHARIAILRGVENGVAVARAARSGVLTATDPYGRLVAHARSSGPMTVVVGDVPVARTLRPTPYTRAGSSFGWLFVAIAMAATMRSTLTGRRVAPSPVPKHRDTA